MKNKDPVLFVDERQQHDYIYVKDVVAANMLAAAAKESCIVNCGFGKAITGDGLVGHLNVILGKDRKPVFERVPRPVPRQVQTLSSMENAKEKIGFIPAYPIERGLKDYFESGELV